MASLRKHVILVSFPTIDHIAVNMTLAKTLQSINLDVTLLTSQALIKKAACQKLLPDESDSLKFVGLPDEISEDAENHPGPALRERLHQKSSQSLQQFFLEVLVHKPGTEIVTQHNVASGTNVRAVDFVICDYFCPSPFRICHQRGIPCHLFVPTSAAVFNGFLNIEDEIFASPRASPILGNPTQQLVRKPSRQMSPLDKAFITRCNGAVQYASSVLINTVMELEKNVLQKIEQNLQVNHVPVHAVGPVIPQRQSKTDQLWNNDVVEKWLNMQSPKSTILVSLESTISLRPEQITEITKALLSLERPFVWILADESINSLPIELQGHIDNQFNPLSRFLLLQFFTPTEALLRHPAIRTFVANGQWEDVLESVELAVPLVFWPTTYDEHVNSDWLGKAGVGFRIPGTGLTSNRTVHEAEIAAAVNLVGGWDTAEDRFYVVVQKLAEMVKEQKVEGRCTQMRSALGVERAA